MTQLETQLAFEIENERLREALEFYAKEENHEATLRDAGCGCCSDTVMPPVDLDEGHKAREALSQPPVTTGLLDVVRAARLQLQKYNEYMEETSVNRYRDREDVYLMACRETVKAVNALPPETLKMLEDAHE